MSNAGDCYKLRLPLRTQRLILRDLVDEDMDDLFVLCTHPDTCRYIRPAMTREAVEEHLNNRKRPWLFEDGTWFSLAVQLPDSRHMIGEVVFRFESMNDRRAEIGYRFHPDVWGNGYAYEAMDGLCQALFQRLDCHKLVAYFDPQNTASRKLLDRLGMKDEGLRREQYFVYDRWNDSQTYGLLRKEFTSPFGPLLPNPDPED